MCSTCLGEPHRAFTSKEDDPVAVVLSDQGFPANVLAIDGGECLRVIRVEDGTVGELVSEMLVMTRGRSLKPGSVIVLGSLTQLGRDGTAWHASEWKKGRILLRKELGDVIVVPLLPLVTADVQEEHTVRSLKEILNWIDDMEGGETELLKGVRRQYVHEFLGEATEGDRWADGLQPLKLPISVQQGEGLTLYRSKNWGRLPRFLKAVGEHEEAVWVGKLCVGMNLEIGFSLATTFCTGRTLTAIRAQEEGGSELRMEVIGASNATRTVASLVRKGVNATKAGRPNWSLQVEKDVDDIILELRGRGMAGKVLVFHCLDNGTFFSMNKTGGTSLPRRDKSDRIFHVPGRLIVASGYALELMLDNVMKISRAVEPSMTVIITPMPRFLDPCCVAHKEGKGEDRIREEQDRLLKAVSSMKKETQQILARVHLKNFLVVGLMDVLGVRDPEKVKEVMADGVHLNQQALDQVMDQVLTRVEDLLVSKKKGPTDRGQRPEKRFRHSVGDAGPVRGGRGGHGGPSRGGWKGGCSYTYH